MTIDQLIAGRTYVPDTPVMFNGYRVKVSGKVTMCRVNSEHLHIGADCWHRDNEVRVPS